MHLSFYVKKIFIQFNITLLRQDYFCSHDLVFHEQVCFLLKILNQHVALALLEIEHG